MVFGMRIRYAHYKALVSVYICSFIVGGRLKNTRGIPYLRANEHHPYIFRRKLTVITPPQLVLLHGAGKKKKPPVTNGGW